MSQEERRASEASFAEEFNFPSQRGCAKPRNTSLGSLRSSSQTGTAASWLKRLRHQHSKVATCPYFSTISTLHNLDRPLQLPTSMERSTQTTVDDDLGNSSHKHARHAEAMEVEEPEPGVMRTQDRPQTGWKDLHDVERPDSAGTSKARPGGGSTFVPGSVGVDRPTFLTSLKSVPRVLRLAGKFFWMTVTQLSCCLEHALHSRKRRFLKRSRRF